MSYYAQLGAQKREREETERARKQLEQDKERVSANEIREFQRELEAAEEKKKKEKEKEEENKALQALVQSTRGVQGAVPELPSATKPQAKDLLGAGRSSSSKSSKDGFFGNIAGLGKDVAGSALHMAGTAGKGLLNLGNVVNPFSDYSMADMRESAKEQEKVNSEKFVPYSGDYSSNLSREVGRGVQRIGDSASLGMMGDSIRSNENIDDSSFDERGGAGAFGDVAYGILGSLGPGGLVAKSIRGTRMGAQVAPNMSKLGKIGQYAKEGAAAGGAYGAMDAHAYEALNPGERSGMEHLGNIGMEAGLGAVLDPAIMGLTNVAGRGVRGIKDNLLPKKSTQSEIAKLPTGSRLAEPKVESDSPIARTESTSVMNKIRSIPQKLRDAKGKVKYEVESEASFIKDIEDALVKGDQSNSVDLKRLSNGTLDASDSFVKSLKRTNLSPQKAAETISKDYTPLFRQLPEANLPTLHDANGKKLSDIDIFDDYVAAKHFNDILQNNADQAVRASEIEAQLKTDTTLSDEVVDDLVKELEGLQEYYIPKQATPEWIEKTLQQHKGNKRLEELQQKFVQEQKKDIQTLYDAGEFTAKQADTIINAHPNYVSMRRNIDGLADFAKNTGTSKTRHKATVKARNQGSLDQILSPSESAIHNRFRAVKAADMNVAKSKLANLAKLDKDGLVLRKVNANEAHLNQKNIVSYKQNGKEQFYEVPENLKMTIDNFGGEEAAMWLTKFVESVGRFSKKGMTHYNPKFHLKASVRDTQNALMTTRTGANPIDMAAGFMDSFFGPQLSKMTGGKFKSYKEVYKEMGAEHANWIRHDPVDINRVLKDVQKGKTGKGDSVLNPFNAIEKLGQATEMGPRLGEFRSAMKKGHSADGALNEAIDVIDYQDIGKSVQKLNKLIPYLGPTIRGNVRFLRQLKDAPIATMTKGFSTIGLATAGIHMMRYSDATSDAQREKLENMPEWQKNLFWAIPNPGEGDNLIMIPKGFLVGQMFSNPIERALDQMFGKENKDNATILKETRADFVEALMPPTTMAGITTIIELVNNQDNFLGMPIVTDDMAEKPKTEQYDESTSELAKIVGKMMGLSPAQVDHVMKSTTGGLGKDLLDLGDNVAAEAGMRPAGIRPTSQILNPLDQFQFNETGSSKFASELYEANKAETGTKSRVRGEFKDQTGLRMANDDAGQSDVGYYNELFRDVNQEIKGVRQDEQMNPTQKREAISALRNEQRGYGSRLTDEGVLSNQEQSLQDLESRLGALGPANVTPSDLKEVLGEQLLAQGVPREEVKKVLELDLTQDQLVNALQQLMSN